jgi:hypothetical protein
MRVIALMPLPSTSRDNLFVAQCLTRYATMTVTVKPDEFPEDCCAICRLGVVSPIALFAVYFCCNASSDWWLLLWPTAVFLLGDTEQPPTSFELWAKWYLSLAANPILYALVGVIVASLVAGVRLLRRG